MSNKCYFCGSENSKPIISDNGVSTDLALCQTCVDLRAQPIVFIPTFGLISICPDTIVVHKLLNELLPPAPPILQEGV